MIKVHFSSLFRAAAKELERHKLAQVFEDEFSVPGAVRGCSVLIVDEVEPVLAQETVEQASPVPGTGTRLRI